MYVCTYIKSLTETNYQITKCKLSFSANRLRLATSPRSDSSLKRLNFPIILHMDSLFNIQCMLSRSTCIVVTSQHSTAQHSNNNEAKTFAALNKQKLSSKFIRRNKQKSIKTDDISSNVYQPHRSITTEWMNTEQSRTSSVSGKLTFVLGFFLFVTAMFTRIHSYNS